VPSQWENFWKGYKIAEKWKEKGRKKLGKAATWENFWKGYKMKRNRKYKGGINNIRYTYECHEPLFFPYYFELTLQIHEPDEFECDIKPFLFLQDGAPSHSSKWTERRLRQEGISILEHVGNSPDMNAIESGWMPMRISITKDWNRLHTIEWTERAWRGEWEILH
jgi:hypothetical protein